MNVAEASATCPQCRSGASLLVRARDLNHKIDASTFDYFRCESCALVFLHPVPHDLSKYYETEYPPYRIPTSAAELEEAGIPVRWRVAYLQQHVRSGRILEIGPSYGGFAYEAVKAGFQVDAIEMDGKCCEFINTHIAGARAIHASDVPAALSNLQPGYSAVVLWHNLEHLTDPWSALEQAVGRLAPGGVLVISTPNPDSYQFALFKQYWVHLDAPRHVVLVPQALLTRFLAARGMALVSSTTTDPDGSTLNRMGWQTSPKLSAADAAESFGRLRKRAFRLMRWVFAPLERWRQRGAAYTAVYRKTGSG